MGAAYLIKFKGRHFANLGHNTIYISRRFEDASSNDGGWLSRKCSRILSKVDFIESHVRQFGFKQEPVVGRELESNHKSPEQLPTEFFIAFVAPIKSIWAQV